MIATASTIMVTRTPFAIFFWVADHSWRRQRSTVASAQVIGKIPQNLAQAITKAVSHGKRTPNPSNIPSKVGITKSAPIASIVKKAVITR